MEIQLYSGLVLVKDMIWVLQLDPSNGSEYDKPGGVLSEIL